MKVKVEVSEEHLATNAPVSRAIRAKLKPNHYSVAVTGNKIVIRSNKHFGQIFVINHLSRKVRDFLEHFRTRLSVQPFSFEIDLPVEALR